MSPGDKVVMLTPLPTGVLDSFLPPEVKLSQALALAAPDSAGSSGPTNAPNRWVAPLLKHAGYLCKWNGCISAA